MRHMVKFETVFLLGYLKKTQIQIASSSVASASFWVFFAVANSSTCGSSKLISPISPISLSFLLLGSSDLLPVDLFLLLGSSPGFPFGPCVAVFPLEWSELLLLFSLSVAGVFGVLGLLPTGEEGDISNCFSLVENSGIGPNLSRGTLAHLLSPLIFISSSRSLWPSLIWVLRSWSWALAMRQFISRALFL